MSRYSKYERIELLASSARTASENGSEVRPFEGMGDVRGAAFELEVSAAATDAADTLDVKVQTSFDGTNWVDIVYFTQVLGNGGAKRYVAKVSAGDGEDMFENGTALTAGQVRNLLGLRYRAVATIVDSGDADQSFTFGVYAIPM